MGFPGYFLIVWDFIRYARERDIPVGPGRGSAAGSLVAYALRITNIDPLQYDLLFERFLNPDRISMPDIDIDFCMRRRGEVIHYVGEKYGRDQVAQIITFGTLAAKAVIRDVGRVLGVPYAKVDRIAKLIPDMTKSLAEVAKEEPLAGEAARDPEIKQIIDVGSRLEGLTRHASVHAAGVVITPQPPRRARAALQRDKGDEEQIMTQWDMNVIESLGLLKMDFLGLRTLTVIDDAVKIIRQQGDPARPRRGPARRPRDLPHLLRGAHQRHLPVRVARHERPAAAGQADGLRRARRLERPLPAGRPLGRHGRRVHPAQAGRKKFTYALPETKPILEETYGVIVYQEQVMLIAVAVAGFSHGRRRHAAQGDGQEEGRRDGQDEGEVRRRRRRARRGAGEGLEASGTTSSPSPATASTRATASPTPASPTRPPTSRPTTRWPSWRRCSTPS